MTTTERLEAAETESRVGSRALLVTVAGILMKAQTIAISLGTQSPTQPPTRPSHTMR